MHTKNLLNSETSLQDCRPEAQPDLRSSVEKNSTAITFVTGMKTNKARTTKNLIVLSICLESRRLTLDTQSDDFGVASHGAVPVNNMSRILSLYGIQMHHDEEETLMFIRRNSESATFQGPLKFCSRGFTYFDFSCARRHWFLILPVVQTIILCRWFDFYFQNQSDFLFSPAAGPFKTCLPQNGTPNLRHANGSSHQVKAIHCTTSNPEPWVAGLGFWAS